jgi:putative Holliday junction resolvase
MLRSRSLQLQMLTSSSSILALDVGGKRIGVALANAVARIASPLTTLQNSDSMIDELQKLLRHHDVAVVVLGLPRGLDGQHTAQTETVEQFAEMLKMHIDLPLYWQDEAVTSRKAEEELSRRSAAYRKEDIDALAATYILEDFLGEHPEMKA